MKRGRRITWALLVAFAVLLTACAGPKSSNSTTDSGSTQSSTQSSGQSSAPAPAPAPQPQTVAIGLSAPLTSDYAQYGESFKNAATLAVNAFNAKGKIQVKLVAMDSKADPKEAANIAQNFVGDKSIVAVMGDFTSTSSMAAAPIYQRAKLVQLSPTASHPDFTKHGDFIFRNIVTQEIEGRFIARYAYETLGFKKAATIYIQNDWGIAANDNFVQGFKELGGEVLISEKFNPGTKDFANLLTKIREAKPDVLYLGAMYTEAALIAQQARKLNLNVPMIGTGSLYSEKLLELGGDAVEGIYCASAFYPKDPRPEVQAFVNEYKAAYGAEPNMFAAQAYDAANLLLAVIEQGVTDRVQFRDALAGIKDFQGVTGLTNFNANRDVVKDMAKMQVKDGQFTLYESK